MDIIWRNTLYVSNVALQEIMCFIASESMIHLHTVSEYVSHLVPNAYSSFSLVFLAFYVLLLFVL